MKEYSKMEERLRKVEGDQARLDNFPPSDDGIEKPWSDIKQSWVAWSFPQNCLHTFPPCVLEDTSIFPLFSPPLLENNLLKLVKIKLWVWKYSQINRSPLKSPNYNSYFLIKHLQRKVWQRLLMCLATLHKQAAFRICVAVFTFKETECEVGESLLGYDS